MSNYVGCCKYCGQLLNGNNEFENQDTADAWATARCNCSMATIKRRQAEQVENAKERVEQLFGVDCKEYGFSPIANESTIDLLNAAIEHVAGGHVLQVSIATNGDGVAKVSMNSKGNIRVQRSVTRAYQLEE